MKLLAVVPARGGSKRIPGKNLRPLAGQPLVLWSVAVGRALSEVSDVLVSSDDPEIADVCRRAGALVPWLRPAELATDTATTVDTCLHALNWYESEHGQVDGLLLLAPTSPLRRVESARRGCDLFARHRQSSVIAVAPAKSHPMWCFRVEDERMQPFMAENGLHLRSQDLPPAYVVAGSFYLIAPELLRSSETFFIDEMVPLVVDEDEGIDLDTEQDWQRAEVAMALRTQADPGPA